MDCKECKLDRYKELAARRDMKIEQLKAEKHQLLEEMERVCHENKLLWGYWHTTQDRAADAGEAELDEAVDIATTLDEALGIIVKLTARMKNCPCRKASEKNG